MKSWCPTGRRLIGLATEVTEPSAAVAESIVALLASEKIRFASFIGIDKYARLILYLAVNYPNIVKRCILINPELTAGNPTTSIAGLLSKIEHYLPLGLPFRRKYDFWDARCFAHRVKAPCLAILTSQKHENREDIHEIDSIGDNVEILEMIPCITIEHLSKPNADMITNFETVPAKVPMRG